MSKSDDELDEIENRRDEAIAEILFAHCVQLAEHFDTVQIITTKHDGESGTAIFSGGEGNFYGRLASVEECARRMKK